MVGGIILNGLSQMFSNFMSGAGSHFANKAFGESLADKHRYALEQMEQANKYNVENYQRQLDDQLKYSDPAFIRSRLENAGLSASLALGHGGMSSPVSALIGSSSPAGGLSGSPLAHGTNILESMARIRNLDQDTENKKTEGDFAKQSMQTRLDILSSNKLSGILDNNIKAVDALYKEKITQLTIDKMQAEIDSITRTIANAENLTDIERQRMIAYRDSLVNQNELWKSQIKLNEAKTETEGTQQDLNQSLSRLNDANSWSKEFENFKWQNNGTIKPGMNLYQGVMSLIADLPSNLSSTFKEIQSIGDYLNGKFNNLKNFVIKDVQSFIDDVNDIASSTNKLDSFIRMLEKNVGKFADYNNK